MKKLEFARGQILFADLSGAIGSEMGNGRTYEEDKINGTERFRPVLIVSNDVCNFYSPVITVVPISTMTKKKKMKTHVLLVKEFYDFLEKDSIILCEQVMRCAKTRLHSHAGFVSTATQKHVDNALKVQLALD